MSRLPFFLLVALTIFHLVSALALSRVKTTSQVLNKPSPLRVRHKSNNTDTGIIDLSRVKITSRVPNKPSPLRVRCQSKDTDIGMHTLYEGEELVWNFRKKLWSTLYFCHFYWNSKDRSCAVFDRRIYTYHCKTELRVTECYWEARPDGFYIDDGDKWTKINDWN
ncbi:hypothetical protein Vadar_012091 [Vaccinium darrowii]|uniref:Uncharacterized protein n=1 Tax=Vaccinium darrowii TaxID=229202 RepID=A0ACB7Y6V8_9ERIC|nr:hypothetical protein Vadar_012091 [Vaccinium darrowii]